MAFPVAAILTGLKGIGNVLPGVINTVLSIVKDKKKNGEESDESLLVPTIGSSVDSIGTGISISSKRLMNVCGTGTIIGIAVMDYMANGLSWVGIALFAVGAVFSLAMAWITKQSEQ